VTVDVEILAVLLASVFAVVPWAFSIHAKVALIAHSVEQLPELIKELRVKLDEHEDRLDAHDKEIQTIKSKTNSSG